ncbi:hypothetical protein M011DRAFT_96765 [Sporormia fimetaria CBS 119925]|uniref:Uncharacterized protein n=1 Tax=Sporormia fimetaria CBS 119925 TaxID=1340428 RepID=A0A6A6V8P6_9PLEO|nr:hypothetical protein M011DRAFT_96765 [Sporormia fimetaria CBS 119925]
MQDALSDLTLSAEQREQQSNYMHLALSALFVSAEQAEHLKYIVVDDELLQLIVFNSVKYLNSTLGFQSTISFSESLLFTVLISPPVQGTLTPIPENQPRSIHGTSIPAGPSQIYLTITAANTLFSQNRSELQVTLHSC